MVAVPRSSAPGALSEDAAPSRTVLVSAGGQRFALPLAAVREVVVPRGPLARVPWAGPAVRGAMNLRGRVVAVVRLAPLTGPGPDELAPAQGHILLLDGPWRGLGLHVSAVLGIESCVLPAPPADGDELDLGPIETGGGPVTLLDPEVLARRAAEEVCRGRRGLPAPCSHAGTDVTVERGPTTAGGNPWRSESSSSTTPSSCGT